MCFNNLSGCELVTLASILSIYISNDLTPDEIDTIATFFTQVVKNLSKFANQKQKRI